MVTYAEWDLRVHEIKGKIDRGELIPDPDWQRGYIWKQNDEALLIDTIMRQMPMPNFYLTEEYDRRKGASIHYAVDGQQRLTAIYKFLNNRFPVEIDGNKYYFKDLDVQTQQKITTYKLSGHYLQNFTQADINFLFQRLNRTGFKLTNAELWHNEYYETTLLTTISQIQNEHKNYYVPIVYTEENIRRMLPLDDLIDLSNCLLNGSVQGGGKQELGDFLSNRKNISSTDGTRLKSIIRKTMRNLQELFTKQDLESTLYGKRTHFITLVLALGLLITEYYLLADAKNLRKSLLDFIENQPADYQESVLGAIRKKDKRKTRVELVQQVIRHHARQLDPNRFFPEQARMTLWRHSPGHNCAICGKAISAFQYAVVDHKEAWARGGRTDETNAQLAHKRCNQQKNAKAEEFVFVVS